MDYERARAMLLHARTRKELNSKKLCNATYLKRGSYFGELPDVVRLELFDTTIMQWEPAGGILLNGDMHQPTTKERFNRYLPNGIRVWQCKYRGSKRYWYVHTPTGVRPFRNHMRISSRGEDLDKEFLNRFDAIKMQEQVTAYAKYYVERLMRGELNKEQEVLLPFTDGTDGADVSDEFGAYVLDQVTGQHTPWTLILQALESRDVRMDTIGVARQTLRDVVEMCWTESQKFWRRPKTKKELIESTEVKMTKPWPRVDLKPRFYAKYLRTVLQQYLLDRLLFEEVE